MFDSNFLFSILSDIEDLVGFLVVIAVIGFSLIGNVFKALSEKREKDRRQQNISVPPVSTSSRPPRQAPGPAVNPRAQRLPYAKAASPTAAPRKTALENLEELKQRRLAQIRAQQQQQRPVSRPPVQRLATPQSMPYHQKPQPRSQQSIPVARAIPVAAPLKPAERIVKAQKPSGKKVVISETGMLPVRRDLIHIMRNPRQLRNAIVASEILGKPISLR